MIYAYFWSENVIWFLQIIFIYQVNVPCSIGPFIGNRIYIRVSVHRNCRLKKSNEMPQYADIYLLLNYSTCFGRPSLPSLGVQYS